MQGRLAAALSIAPPLSHNCDPRMTDPGRAQELAAARSDIFDRMPGGLDLLQIHYIERSLSFILCPGLITVEETALDVQGSVLLDCSLPLDRSAHTQRR